MTVIATASNPRFSVSRVDIDRGGPTYTIDTLRDLRAAQAGRRPVLHHRRRRARPDPHLARRRAGLRARALRRLHAARHRRSTTTTLQGLPADRVDHHRGPGAGHLVDRVPRAGPQGRAGLVPRARRRRAVHRQARALPAARSAEPLGEPSAGPRQPPCTRTAERTPRPRNRVTATDRAIELVTTAAQAASRQARRRHHRLRRVRPARHHRRLRALLGVRTTGRSSRSSTRSRRSSARSAPSRSGARASATDAGC